ncbi:MAG: type II toxin-antitoxin system mRNA interferase toxin, RelE/StbE family [bacterium]
MKVFYAKTFKKDFQELSQEIKLITQKKLELFVNDFRHPSLRIKKMEGLNNIWEGRINDNYRFTFQVDGDICILRRIGSHNILKKEK